MTKVTELAAPGVSPQATPNPGTTVWVPMWNLAGGSSNAYKGDWAAGTYYPGDHVVYNGILYECVRQTTAAPVPWPPAPGAASYGTTLPASPVDGQEAILVDSVTNPSYQWRFRYNAGSTSAYKWEFVGGVPQFAAGGNLNNYTGSALTPLSSGPNVPIVRAGEYLVGLGIFMQNQSGVAGAYNLNAQLYKSAGTVGVGQVLSFVTTGTFGGGLIYADQRLTLAAGDSLNINVGGSASTSSSFSLGQIKVQPVRVS